MATEVNGLMESIQRNITVSQRPVSEERISIIGANHLQNNLLGSYIEMETGIACDCRFDITMSPGEKPRLVLYDCFSVDYTRLWMLLGAFFNQGRADTFLSLFNVDTDAKLERDAVSRGIRGVFYRNESPGALSKGVEAMLRGELWYSRKITARLLLNQDGYSNASQMASAGLTVREKEVLLAVAAGASNNDIAEKFYISAHTAKNHIYNIYKKIKVKSRLEAILWVTNYL
ncbi:MAG: LuxR C-terminal-related transcriptional regulator [Pseudomonadota bacterium]